MAGTIVEDGEMININSGWLLVHFEGAHNYGNIIFHHGDVSRSVPIYRAQGFTVKIRNNLGFCFGSNLLCQL